MRKRRGFNVAAYDITYGESSKGDAHDFLESAGFLSQPQGNTQMHACMFFGIPHMHALRVACFGILKLHAGCMSLMAPDCRCWGAPARGTSFRNPLNPNGVGRQFVMDGNKMASRFLACMELKLESNIYAYNVQMYSCMRLVLLCLLCLSNHAIFLVEQPRQSLLYAYYRWQWLQNRVAWASCIGYRVCCLFHACMHM